MYNDPYTEVKCVKCGTIFTIHKVTKRRKIKENAENPQYFCPKCLRDASSQRNKKAWEEKSEEEKEAKKKMLNEEREKFIKNVDPETRKNINEKISKKRKMFWDNATDEYRANHGKKHKEWWASLTDEEKEIQFAPMRKGFIEWYYSLSDEDRDKYNQSKTNWSKDFWNNLSGDDLNEWINKRCADDKFLVPRSENEINLAEILNRSKIQYELHKYNKIKHPDFDKLFPYNKVTGAKIVIPYHQWDFLVHTNSGDVFIDIDGSMHAVKDFTIHYYTGIDINIRDIQEYNDSQRPYQTDSLVAYIIQCYDDKLTDETPVINVITNEKMKFSELMAIIRFMDAPKDDIQSIIKNL